MHLAVYHGLWQRRPPGSPDHVVSADEFLTRAGASDGAALIFKSLLRQRGYAWVALPDTDDNVTVFVTTGNGHGGKEAGPQ